ncbi:DUF3318 domain-containing protein [Paraburkholderia sp. J76]|uniref:DUF3318 domain-containing protein n=1 Tax=Paraburkholderia sp. J76 TaxID=2805439 RepID=UPI002ABE201E|nr:DUF3318 domain-containing protein [Paraburkholderia sp. J76]
MNQSRTDNAFRPRHGRAHDLSTPQLRALRKELLLVRASVERAEMAEALIDIRTTVTNFSWLRFVVPGFGRIGSGGGVASGLGSLLKEYPLISSLVSLILAKPLRTTIVSAARPVIKWGGLAFTAWEAYRVWQQVRRQRGASTNAPARAKSGEDDLTG